MVASSDAERKRRSPAVTVASRAIYN